MSEISNVITAFSECSVERLTGLTAAQLRYWEKTGFVAPAYADEDRRTPFGRIYSFKDVVALRTLALLRHEHNISLRQLRQVAKEFSHLTDDAWTETALYVLDRQVIINGPGRSGRLPEAASGQYVTEIPLKNVIADTKRDAERLLRRPEAKVGKVEQSRQVLGNAPVIAGTRIPTAAIRRYKEAGFTVEQILTEYPNITPDDIEAALKYEENKAPAG